MDDDTRSNNWDFEFNLQSQSCDLFWQWSVKRHHSSHDFLVMSTPQSSRKEKLPTTKVFWFLTLSCRAANKDYCSNLFRKTANVQLKMIVSSHEKKWLYQNFRWTDTFGRITVLIIKRWVTVSIHSPLVMKTVWSIISTVLDTVGLLEIFADSVVGVNVAKATFVFTIENFFNFTPRGTTIIIQNVSIVAFFILEPIITLNGVLTSLHQFGANFKICKCFFVANVHFPAEN